MASGALRLLPSLNFDLGANVVRFQTDMNSAVVIAEKSVGKIQGAFQKLSASIAGLGATFAIGKILEEAAQGERSFSQLQAAVKSTGGAAGLTAKQLSDMAGALQKVSTFDDDAIAGGQSILLTFTKIGKEVFPQATKAALDMATRLGTDVNSAAVQLGKALQDPVKGITALSKAGVSFSEAQKAQIKGLVEHNKLLDAQKIILKELQKEFAGSAEAARRTIGGSMTAAKNSFDNLLEAIGKVQTSGIQQFFNKLADSFDFLSDHAQILSNGIMGIAGAGVMMQLAKLPAMFKMIGDVATKMFAGMSTGAAAATMGLSLLVAAAITFKDETFEIGDQQVTLQNLIIGAWDTIQQRLQQFWKENGAVIMQTLQSWSTSFSEFFAGVFKTFEGAIQNVAKIAGELAKNPLFASTFTPMLGGLNSALRAFDALKKGMKPASDAFRGFVDDTVKDAARLTKAQQQVAKDLLPPGAHPDTDANGAGAGAAKHASEFAKHLAGLDAANAKLREEIAGNAELGKLKQEQAQLEARIGALSADEVKKLQAALTLNRELTIQKQLQSQIAQIKGQGSELDLQLSGASREEITRRQVLNSLKQQGIEYDKVGAESQKQINALVAETIANERKRADILTKETMKSLDEQIAKTTDLIELGKDQADIEAQVRAARKANPWITEAQVGLLRERLKIEQQLAKLAAGAEYVRSMKDQTKELEEQLKERKLIADGLEKEAALEKAVFEWTKKTGMQIDDNTRSILKQQVERQQFVKDSTRALEIQESIKTDAQKYADKLRELNDLRRQDLLTLDQYQKAVAAINPQMQSIKDAAKQFGDVFTNAFDSMLFKGEKFTDVLKNMGKELLHIIAQKAVFEPLGNWVSSKITDFFTGRIKGPTPQTGIAGGGTGTPTLNYDPNAIANAADPLAYLRQAGINIPGYASGGYVPPGQLSLVGEKGPELFMSKQGGTVLPNAFLNLFTGNDFGILSGLLKLPMLFGGLASMFGGGGGGGSVGAGSRPAAAPSMPTYQQQAEAMAQMNDYRADQMHNMGLTLQENLYRNNQLGSSKAWRSWGSRNAANNPAFGFVPQIGQTANDWRGFLDREPGLANVWDPGFINWVNAASGGIGRNSYQALTVAAPGGLNRGEFEIPEFMPTGREIADYKYRQEVDKHFADVNRPTAFSKNNPWFSGFGVRDYFNGQAVRTGPSSPQFHRDAQSAVARLNTTISPRNTVVPTWDGSINYRPLTPYSLRDASGLSPISFESEYTAGLGSQELDRLMEQHRGLVIGAQKDAAKFFTTKYPEITDPQSMLKSFLGRSVIAHPDFFEARGRELPFDHFTGPMYVFPKYRNDPEFSGMGFADGGNPPVGFASMVGEEGPELFVPHEAGTIVPNNRLADAFGGGGDVHIEIVNTTGQPVQVEEQPSGGVDQKAARIMFGQMLEGAMAPGGVGYKQIERYFHIKKK